MHEKLKQSNRFSVGDYVALPYGGFGMIASDLDDLGYHIVTKTDWDLFKPEEMTLMTPKEKENG